MQTQEQKQRTAQKAKEAKLKGKLGATRAQKVVVKTRYVELRYKSCCGCGCNYYRIGRTVPFNSSVKDGDTISEYDEHNGDAFLGDW